MRPEPSEENGVLQIAATNPNLGQALAAHERAGRFQLYGARILGFLVPAGGFAWASMIWPRLIPLRYHPFVVLGWPVLLGCYVVAKALEWKETLKMMNSCRRTTPVGGPGGDPSWT